MKNGLTYGIEDSEARPGIPTRRGRGRLLAGMACGVVLLVLMPLGGAISRGAGDSALHIDPSGRVGINTRDPQARLHVNGDVKVSGRIGDKTGLVMPVGAILPFAGDNTKVPAGWLLCDGRPLKSAEYPDLFATIGTNYGDGRGADAKTYQFNAPDLRGAFLRGVDGGKDLDKDRKAREPNNPGGLSGDKVGSQQRDEFRRHAHKPLEGSFVVWPAGGPPEQNQAGVPEDWSHANNSTAETGGSETRPVNVYVNYIIKY